MSLLNDLTLAQIFTRLLAVLVVVGVHGFALAGLARLLGDPTPAYTGRLTPNPIVHLAMPALVMGVLFELFWVAPVKLKRERLRWPRAGLIAIALGALAVTLITVPLLQSIRPLIIVALPRSAAFTILSVIDAIQDLSIWFVALNILPLPLLTGGLIALGLVPKLERSFQRSRGIVMALLIAAIVAGLATAWLEPVHDWLAEVLIR